MENFHPAKTIERPHAGCILTDIMKSPKSHALVLPALLACLLPPLALRAETRLVERVEALAGKIVIPYTKYILDNGLTLIVHEDHSDPMVHVDVTYHVGSAREEIGKSGFAHFFEHMMFQGSDHVGDDEHFKIVTQAGGRLNGSTNGDRTNYYETTPVNQLEKILWLEADRMGFFLDAVTQRKFEVQRDTVKNERGQNYDNRPYGLVWETVARTLYPYGHPYSWLTIGYIEDLNRVNVDDLKNFFLRWYGPNNATLTIGGDVKSADVVKLVEKYFGSIPRGPEVVPTKVEPVKLDADRYVTLVDNYARQPRLVVTFPSVPTYHPDEYALDCLAEVLGQGKNSILYQELVKDQKVLSASAANSTDELAGQFMVSITPAPGRSLAETKKLYDDAIKAFEARGVTDEDIARFTGSIEAGLINGLQSVSAKVSRLAQFQTFTGNPNYIGRQLERYTSVTKADVQRVYEKYFKGKPAVILSVATKAAPTNIVAAENFTINKEGYKAPDYGYAGLKYAKAKDNFDRSKMPGSGSNPAVKLPPFWREDLSNGVQAIGAESRELPIVALTFSMPGGHIMHANDLSKAGLAQMFGRMMNEDTQDRSAEQFQTALQMLGSSVFISSGFDEINVSVQSLKKNLDKTLALVEERLLRPKFTESAFNRIKKQTLEGFKMRKSQPAAVASLVYDKVNYGLGNILGVSEMGTEETVKDFTLREVEDFYSRALTRRGSRLSVVGDISQKEIISKVGFLTKLPDREVKLPSLAAAPKIEKNRIYLVDVPKAAQTEFRVGYVTGLKYDATGEFYRVGLANYALGGMFSSRLNLNLREDKAWTYGARSSFAGDKYTGSFTFSSGIRSDATASALREVLKELGNYARSGPTAEDLEFTRTAIGQRDALEYETPSAKARFIMRVLEYKLDPDYPEQQNRILAKIPEKELDAIAAKWLQTNALNIVLVGDKEKIQPSLQQTGFEIVELDTNGEKLSTPAASGGR
jgi:zinc protease